MDMLERIWEQAIRRLGEAESIKHESYGTGKLPTDQQWWAQGVADTLRMLLLLMREDEEFAEQRGEEWREGPRMGAVTGRNTHAEVLCPLDRSVMKFQYQDASRQRYICRAESHTWDYDWRNIWEER